MLCVPRVRRVAPVRSPAYDWPYSKETVQVSQPAGRCGSSARLNPIIVIPARMASARLPGKPLALIAGRPMILHVLAIAQGAAIGPVLVACADAAIAEVVRAAGGTAVLTDPALASGSDRVSAALEAFDPGGTFDTVLNLQGDLPTVPPDYLRRVLAALDDQTFDITTLAAMIRSEVEAASPAVVKVAATLAPDTPVAPALYFSRAAIPWGSGPLLHHIGLYGYRRSVLRRFVALPPSRLEQRESLEQLRALEAGLRIGCSLVETAPHGVDTPDDLERVRRQLGETG